MNTIFLLFILAIKISNMMANGLDSVESCLAIIISKYFRGEAIRIFRGEEVCAEATATDGVPLRHAHCFDVARISSLDATFEVVTKDLDTTSKVRNTFVVTTEEDLSGLRRIISTMKVTSYWNTRVLIVLIGESDESTVREVFGEIWNKTRLMNTVVMASAADGYTTLYSWYPYERGHCESLESVRVIDKCDGNGFHNDSFLFPKYRIRQGLNYCPVKVSASDTPFFSTIPATSKEPESGLDFNIMQELSARYRMTLRFVSPPHRESHWVRFFSNGSLHGTMKMLYNNEIDIGMSGLTVVPETLNIFTCSNIYFIDAVRWFVPKLEDNQRWKSIFAVFSDTMWMTVFVSLLTSSVLIYVFKHVMRASEKPKSYVHSLLEIVGITLAQSMASPPKSLAIRIFLASYVIYSLNITTSYQSVLYGILTAPLPYSPYTSLQAVFDHGLNLYFLPLQVSYYENDALGEEIFKSNQFRKVRNSTSVLREIALHKKGALLHGNSRMRFLLARHFRDANGKSLVDILPETVTLDLIAYHFSPNNPIKELFDMVIYRLVQAGFINKWKRNLLLPHGDTVAEQRLISLSINSLFSVFQLYFVLMIISLIIFLYEISWSLIKGCGAKQRTNRRNWLNN